MLSSSSSFLPTRISKEVGKDIITLVSQIGNINFKKGGDTNAPLHDILRGRWNQVRRGLVAN